MAQGLPRRTGWILFILAVVALANLIALRNPRALDSAPLPRPNGYDEFVAIGSRVHVPEYTVQKPPTDAEIDAYVATNRPVIDLVGAALKLDCRVPVPDRPENWAPHAEQLQHINRLTQAFRWQADSAARHQNWTLYSATLTNSLLYFHQITRGGLVIDDMLANLGIREAVRRCRTVLASFPAPMAAANARAILAADRLREPFTEINQRELAFGRRVAGLGAKITWWIQGRRESIQLAATHESRRTPTWVELRELALRLAAHAYQLDHGRLPPDAAALVPDYLPELPADPVSGQPLALPSDSTAR